MAKEFMRVWQESDMAEIKQHLFVAGLTGGVCENCSALFQDLTLRQCPSCKQTFRYLTPREELLHDPSFFKKLKETFAGLICIDHADYKKISGKLKARDIFK